MRLLSVILITLMVLSAGAAHARGRGGGGDQGAAAPARAPTEFATRPLPFDKLASPGFTYDIALLPVVAAAKPAALRVVERELVGLLTRHGLRVAPPHAVRAALSGSAIEDQARIVASHLSARRVMRLNVVYLTAERNLVGGPLLGPALQFVVSGGVISLAKQISPNTTISTAEVIGVASGAFLTLGVSMDAKAAVECTVMDGKTGRVVWTGEQNAEGDRWIFGLLASRDGLIAKTIMSATRRALFTPISMAKIREKATHDEFRQAMDEAVKGDPWAGVSAATMAKNKGK